jgi:hypothetical protein
MHSPGCRGDRCKSACHLPRCYFRDNLGQLASTTTANLSLRHQMSSIDGHKFLVGLAIHMQALAKKQGTCDQTAHLHNNCPG